ncbi:hypothetical protein CFBP3846_03682 [Pseudomonas syringae pv. avii]|uniref:Uncharacterized protein n=1 Tax=Pseudomonas syringae pv. avii TaxID=663959 RepID=A0ABY1U9T3_PSESX|nr:hypothetical protein [Pseudomonas syringae]KWT10595.1 hypothetical protein AL046_00855 [Pseudomonas syringae pv. avii]SOS28089.1 hypothetical protein CFBP3846_03682 [Pseudomonas syringae pv. avii]
MISLELSMVRHNSAASARLAEATEAYMRSGGVIHELSITRGVSLTFNAETIAYGYKASPADHERKAREALELELRTAEKLRAYVGLGLKQASADLGISAKRLGHIAADHGIVFTVAKPSSALAEKRAAEALIAPDIARRFAEKATQQDVIREFGLSPDRLRRIAKEHSIALPGAVNIDADRQLIPRIEAYRDLGIPRTTCAKRLDINQKTLLRILDTYGVTYPVHS